MYFVKVAELPESNENCSKKDIRGLLEEFVKADIKYARVVMDDTEYSRVDSGRQSIQQSIKHYNFPVKVRTRRGVLYLERLTVEDIFKEE